MLDGSHSAGPASAGNHAPDAAHEEPDSLADRRKDPAILLGSMPAQRSDVRRAAFVAGILVLLSLLIMPHAARSLPAIPAIIPLNNVAIIIFDLITAILLYAQYSELRERSFLVLACGYFFIPLIVAAHVASFPQAFGTDPLIGGPQTSALLWMTWHGLTPLFVVAYAVLARGERARRARDQHPSWGLAWLAMLGTAALALALVLAASGAERLPRLVLEGSRYGPFPLTLWVLSLAHIAALLLIMTMRRWRLLDVWIAVAMLAAFIEFALTAIFSDGLYQLGFYAGRVYGLVASAILLAVLLRQAVGLHGRVLQTALALADSEERQSFLLRLGDALRSVSDPVMVQEITARMLANQLGADGVVYAEFFSDQDGSYSDLNWTYYPLRSDAIRRWMPIDQLRVFRHLLSGKRVVVEDALAEEAYSDTARETGRKLGIIALVSVPLFKEGRLVASLSVSQGKPRRWSSSEIALVDEVAERTWAAVERARAETALRESDEVRRIAVASGGMGVWQWRLDVGLIRGDPDAMTLIGLPALHGWVPAARFLERMTPESLAAIEAIIARGAEANEEMRGEVALRIGDEIRWLAWRGRSSSTDPKLIQGVSFDITEQKEAERALQEREELQAFLLKLGDLLRPLQSVADVQFAGCRLLGEHLQVAQVAFGEINKAGDQVTIGRDWCAGSFCAVQGTWRLAEFEGLFESSAKEGRAVVVADVEREPTMGWLQSGEDDNGSKLRSCICVPLVKQSRLAALMFICHTEPRIWTAAERRLVEVTCARLWTERERARAEESLRASEQRLSMALEAARMGTFDWSAATSLSEISPASVKLYGLLEPRSQLNGAQYNALIHPDDVDHHRAVVRHVIETGQDMQDEFRIIRPCDGEVVWLEERGSPSIDPVTGELRMKGIHIDITEKKKQEQALRQSQVRQQLLLAELQHRVRNIMAMIRSMARRTSRGSKSVEEYVALFEGRIDAMARTQTLLTRKMGDGVDLQDLIIHELEAQSAQEKQFFYDGPQVALSPKAAEVLSLAIHELATNATKYGALSSTQGRIDVRWHLEEREGQRWLSLVWSEAGVVLDDLPRREGFGTELITGRVPYELGGKGTMSVSRSGLVATIEFPLVPGESTLQTDIDNLGN